MAHKRRVEIEVKAPSKEEEAPQELSWKDWLLKKYARAWYVLGCLFFDIMLFLEMQRSMSTGALVAGTVTLVLIIAQVILFLHIWGRGGPLADDETDEL